MFTVELLHNMLNVYVTLGIRETASAEDIKRAYHKKVMIYHPDKNPGCEKAFLQVQEAYEILCNEEKKREYDSHQMTDSNIPVRRYKSYGHTHKYATPISVDEILRKDAELHRRTSGKSLKELLKEQRFQQEEVRTRRQLAQHIQQDPILSKDTSLHYKDIYELLESSEAAVRRSYILEHLADYEHPTQIDMYRLFMKGSEEALKYRSDPPSGPFAPPKASE